jgi:hypothetical protein
LLYSQMVHRLVAHWISVNFMHYDDCEKFWQGAICFSYQAKMESTYWFRLPDHLNLYDILYLPISEWISPFVVEIFEGKWSAPMNQLQSHNWSITSIKPQLALHSSPTSARSFCLGWGRSTSADHSRQSLSTPLRYMSAEVDRRPPMSPALPTEPRNAVKESDQDQYRL